MHLKDRLDAVFEAEPAWAEYVDKYKSVQGWLHAERAEVSHLVMDKFAKR